MSTWVNKDGLEVRYGNTQAAVSRVGKTSSMGEEQELIIDIVGTEVAATATPTIYKHTGLPQGAHFVSATFYVETAFTSTGSATLDLGLWSDDGDGTFTVVDADGIDVDIALTAIDAAGDVIACDGADVGTVIDTVSGGRDLLVVAGYATASLTAGKGKLVCKYLKP